MNCLVVRLWGKELGTLVWDPSTGRTYFAFNPDASDRPDVSPIANPKANWRKEIPIFGDSRRIYHGLPPFISDSLPDSWGNRLFEQWAKQNNITYSKINPILKLMFIGRRGMGALEFEPVARELEHRRSVDIHQLYALSLEILEERESVVLDASKELTMQTLLAVGTSAGGRQMKAILAFNSDSMEMRSGQTDVPPGFEHYIVKFEDKEIPTTEIEMAYYEMAISCGIDMEFCRLIKVEGVSHFMTRRFDRKDGKKLHMQTLAAINPEADSYEDLMLTCRKLGLSEKELIEVFRRLVFNIMANNTDDHNKNFSFLLDEGGKWKLAPAYDMTFIFNMYGSGPEPSHVFSLYGKVSRFTKDDLLDFAKENSIRDAEKIITDVAIALSGFPLLAEKYNIPGQWRHIIHKTIQYNLSLFGYLEMPAKASNFTDTTGRKFQKVSIRTNNKRYYHISAVIEGRSRKRKVKPDTKIYHDVQEYELGNLSDSDFIGLMELLFPDNQ